jgi:hypothetical protein
MIKIEFLFIIYTLIKQQKNYNFKMKHIRMFESYRVKRRRDDVIKESVLQVNDIYKVRIMADVPQSLLNAYVKKVKDNVGKNLKQFFGDMDLAEEIVKWVVQNGLDTDKMPANALVGGAQGQGQSAQQAPAQMQMAPQGQAQTQMAPEGQMAPQGQAQPQSQGQMAPQGQAQPQVQTETQPQAQGQMAPQGQAQPQGQGQAQPQAQAQGQGFEEVNPEEEEEEENEEELPS